MTNPSNAGKETMMKWMMMVLALVVAVPAAAQENNPLVEALRGLAAINAGAGQLADVARSFGCAEQALDGKFPPGCNRENTPLDPGALIFQGNGTTQPGRRTVIYGDRQPLFVNRDLEQRREALQAAKCRNPNAAFRAVNGCKN